MNDLWKGMAHVAVDPALRLEVSAKAKYQVRPELPEPLRNQPDRQALRDIDASFRNRGLFLSAYALGEINRWFLAGGAPFLEALESLRTAIARSLGTGATVQSPGFLEAVGLLVVDPGVRAFFIRNEMNLQDSGIQITALEEEALRSDFRVNSNGERFAELIFDLGWSGTSCLGVLRAYDGMLHSNR